MNAISYPQGNAASEAQRDTIPLPLAKLARRLAQLPKDKAHRVTLWFEGDKPRWTIEEVARVEGG